MPQKRLRTGGTALLSMILPALGMLLLIHHYAVNVPATDDYALIPMFQGLDHGHIPWGAFWAQHNEHRIFFPTLILVSLARLTHWNILAEIYLSFIIACITFVGLAMLIGRRVNDPRLRFLALFLSAIFFFSPVQWQNWLWGWQLEWFLCVACIVWTINLLDRTKPENGPRRLIISGLIASVATFSLASGLLAWVGGLAILLWRKFRRSYIVGWIIAAAASVGLYYYHYKQPADSLASHTFVHHMPTFMKHYLAYVGRPVSAESHAAFLAGCYILLAFVICAMFVMYKRKTANMIALLALGVIALINGVLTGVGRFNDGIIGAMSSRYTAFSELLIIAVIALAAGLLATFKYKQISLNVILAAAVLLSIPAVVDSWANGVSGMASQHQAYVYIYTCTRAEKPDSNCLYQAYFPSAQVAKADIDYLKQRGYGGY